MTVTSVAEFMGRFTHTFLVTIFPLISEPPYPTSPAWSGASSVLIRAVCRTGTRLCRLTGPPGRDGDAANGESARTAGLVRGVEPFESATPLEGLCRGMPRREWIGVFGVEGADGLAMAAGAVVGVATKGGWVPAGGVVWD